MGEGSASWLRRWPGWLGTRVRQARLTAVLLPVGTVLLAAGLAWRWVLGPAGGVGDPDGAESVVLLMARHLAEGHWPGLYVWGSRAMGSLEVPLAALALLAGGADLESLRLVPFLAAVAAVLGCVVLATRWLGWRAGAVAAGLSALAFPVPAAELARELGGLSLGVLLGLMALGEAATVSILAPRKASVAAGLLCGLALAANPGLAPLGVGVAVTALAGLSRLVREPSRVLIGFHHLLRFLVALAVGSSPVWVGPGPDAWTVLEPLRVAQAASQNAQPMAARGVELAGGGLPLLLVLSLVVLAGVGTAARLADRGLEDRGARLGVGAVATALASVVFTLASHPGDDALVRAVPLLAGLPWLGAVACARRGTAVATLLVAGWLLVRVDPTALPVPPEPGAELSVDAAVEYLARHPHLKCYAPDGLASRIAAADSLGHSCVPLGSREVRRSWRADGAAGKRAYFFPPGAQDMARDLDAALAAAHLRARQDVAGPFLVRLTDGLAWPPVVPPVVWEHGKRDHRTTIDGNPATSSQVPAGQTLRMDLVWPTALQAVRVWQDVTALGSAPCSARAGITLPDGREEWGPAVNLQDSCHLARDWALLPTASVELRLPVPRREAVSILVQALDRPGTSVLAASEIRVVPLEADNPLGHSPASPAGGLRAR